MHYRVLRFLDDDEYAFIDVLGDDECGPIGDFRPVYSLPDQVTEIVVEEEQITGKASSCFLFSPLFYMSVMSFNLILL